VNGTLQAAVDKINALPHQPEFIIHTGDLTHLAKPAEFDTMDQILKGAKTKEIHTVPGEHDVATDDGQQYRNATARRPKVTAGIRSTIRACTS